VFEVSPGGATTLRATLERGLPTDAEWRPVPHARFSVKADGVVLTCYRSGKVVVQGRDIDAFMARFLADTPLRTGAGRGDADDRLDLDARTAASDEAGKGDYFGPLVVAAVFAGPRDAERLRRIGAVDSKALGDDRARRLAGLLQAEFDHEVVSLEPEEYNRAHAEVRNVNVILADLHARVLAALATRHPDTEVIVVDQFENRGLVETALKKQRVGVPRLIKVTRAERHPVVAAASVVARAAFLEGLDRCSDACGTDLHKGAGPPVDVVARRVDQIGGRILLAKVAKMHFKNTDKIRGAR